MKIEGVGGGGCVTPHWLRTDCNLQLLLLRHSTFWVSVNISQILKTVFLSYFSDISLHRLQPAATPPQTLKPFEAFTSPGGQWVNALSPPWSMTQWIVKVLSNIAPRQGVLQFCVRFVIFESAAQWISPVWAFAEESIWMHFVKGYLLQIQICKCLQAVRALVMVSCQLVLQSCPD